MAKRIEKLPLRLNKGSPTYPWHEWLDGSIWELHRPEDFKITVPGLRTTAAAAARSRGVRVITRSPDADTIYIQAVPRDLPQ